MSLDEAVLGQNGQVPEELVLKTPDGLRYLQSQGAMLKAQHKNSVQGHHKF